MLSTLILLGATRLSTVAIDLPEDTPPETVQRVVESCNQALGGPRCKAADDSIDTTLLAVVRWEGAELQISLVRADRQDVVVDSRRVAFSETDAPRDRFIAAGLMVAALTAAQTATPPADEVSAPPAPPPRPPAPPPAPPPAAPEPTLPPTPVHAGVDIAGLVAQGFGDQPAAWGGELRLFWLSHRARIGVATGGNALRGTDATTLTWASMSGGLLVQPTPWSSPVGLQILGEGVAQYTRASATRGSETQSASLWRLGGRLSALGTLATGSALEPYVGLELTLLERGFTVTVEGESVGSEPELRMAAALGLRLTPF